MEDILLLVVVGIIKAVIQVTEKNIPNKKQLVQQYLAMLVVFWLKGTNLTEFLIFLFFDYFFLFKVQIFAAGFDSSRNIFLGEKATKWQKKNGECDGLTTNGVLIIHPNWCNGEELSVNIFLFLVKILLFF